MKPKPPELSFQWLSKLLVHRYLLTPPFTLPATLSMAPRTPVSVGESHFDASSTYLLARAGFSNCLIGLILTCLLSDIVSGTGCWGTLLATCSRPFQHKAKPPAMLEIRYLMNKLQHW